MTRVPVFYATTDGQTERIAEHIAGRLRAGGFASVAMNVDSSEAREYDIRHTSGIVLAASLRKGRHQQSAEAFARAHRDRMEAVPSWFVSVSLSAASCNAEERQAAERLAQAFATTTGCRPWRTTCVAGALAYTRYSWLTRWMMRRIAEKEGGPTDTSHDHELTDWPALDVVTDAFARDVVAVAGANDFWAATTRSGPSRMPAV